MAKEPQATEAAPEKKKKRLPKTLAIVLAVAVVQGIALFLVFKMAGGGPEAAHGEANPAIEGGAASQPVDCAEVQLLRSFKVPNDKSGVLRIYDLDVSIVVPADQKEEVEKLVQERAAEIADQIGRIVRGATDRMLREDDLRVLRGQLREGLQEITRDERLIQRVLIPKFVPIRAE